MPKISRLISKRCFYYHLILSLLMLLVISNATLYVFLHGFAGEGGPRNAIYLDSSSLAGFHAIPFVEQTLFYFIEVVGSLLVGKRLNLYYFSFLDIDRKGSIATKSFYVFTQGGGIDDVSTVSFLGHYLRV